MESIGPIQLPLKKVIRLSNEMDIIDMLLDSKVPYITQALQEMDDYNKPQILAFRKEEPIHFVGIVLYQPPDIWLDYDNQKYQAMVGPNIPKLIEYFHYIRMDSKDPFEIGMVTKIIYYINNLEKALRQEQQKYNYSSSTSTLM